MAKQTKKQATPKVDHKEKITSAYKEYVLIHGKKPTTVFQFTKHIDMQEEDFYKYFSTFEAVDREIWKGFIQQTLNGIKAEKVYKQYGAREKMLAFLYTLIEVLKKDRSYVNATFKRSRKPELVPDQLKGFKEHFDAFSEEIIAEGEGSDEIVSRPYISDRYKDGLWLQLVFVISFWLRDSSQNFERTDAAIEKAANLSFELMGRGPLDLMVDFGKFLFQNR